MNARKFLPLVVVFLAIALPRWLVVDQVATIDENRWVIRAANFATGMRHGDLARTYQSEHPGVTTMWAGTVGLNRLIPGFGVQNPAQFSEEDDDYGFDSFLREQDVSPLEALVAGRRMMVLFNALILTLVFMYVCRLLDLETALLAVAFSAFSPFFLAHTHLMHVDGLAGSLMVLSLVSFLSYENEARKIDLALSGVSAGLAWLTKTPAFFLGPALLIIVMMMIWERRDDQAGGSALFGPPLSWVAWTFIGLLFFALFWPAVWAEPVTTLRTIFSAAFDYAGGGHGDPVFFNGIIYENGRIPARIFYFYPLTVLWRSTPAVLCGLAAAILALWRHWSPLDRRSARSTVLFLFLYILLFTLFMTLGTKKFDRYLIPIYPALHIISAAGWVTLIRLLASRWVNNDPSRKHVLAAALLALVTAWQILALRSVWPYPLSYYDPLLGGSERAPQVMQIGWGEGLDKVGRYLGNKPESDQLTVASWYSSVLEHHFDGKVISVRYDLGPADYAVLYIHQWQRDIPPDLLDEFAARDPEHVIEINGLEYARIYDLRD